MSHEVEIRDGIASMAFAHDVPWHGLGVKVDPNTPPEDMGKAAQIDWGVEKRQLYTWSNPTKEQLESGAILPPMQPIPDRYALTRDTDGKVMSIVTGRWNPVQNSEILATFKKFVDEGGATMETAGALKGGKLVWALANLNHGFTINGDPVKGYLLLATMHEPGYATIGRVTPVQVVCANTFAQAGGFDGKAQLRVPHTREFKAEEAAEQIGLAHQMLSEFERNAKLLTSLNISRDDAINILAPIYQPDIEPKELISDFEKANRTVRGIMEAALAGPHKGIADTGYGLLSGVTYYANHKARGTKDSRFASALVGDSNAKANKVFRQLVDMAEA